MFGVVTVGERCGDDDELLDLGLGVILILAFFGLGLDYFYLCCNFVFGHFRPVRSGLVSMGVSLIDFCQSRIWVSGGHGIILIFRNFIFLI